MTAVVNRQRYTEGTGKSKREAKQNAAKKALDGIKSTQNTESVSTNILYRLGILLCVCVYIILMLQILQYHIFTGIVIHLLIYIHVYTNILLIFSYILLVLHLRMHI